MKLDESPYMRRLLEQVVSKHIKKSVGFHLPVFKSTTLFIVPDYTGTLAEGEIFVNLSAGSVDHVTLETTYTLIGDVLLSRSPAILPSDVQKVRAVDCPALRFRSDVVFASIRGKRALADLLSGGDYDGDVMTVIWEVSSRSPRSRTNQSDYRLITALHRERVSERPIRLLYPACWL